MGAGGGLREEEGEELLRIPGKGGVSGLREASKIHFWDLK